MIAIATANLPRFSGADKADILDQRGGAYSMQKDYENAAKDYADAATLDPTSLVHQTNAAETYQSLGNKEKALEFANKVKNNPKASKSDIETVEKVIATFK
jgi:tetratricopeptide (TPR) repeat protein